MKTKIIHNSLNIIGYIQTYPNKSGENVNKNMNPQHDQINAKAEERFQTQ